VIGLGLKENSGFTQIGFQRLRTPRGAMIVFLRTRRSWLNAKVHLPYWYRVSPYIGAGVGGSVSVLDVDHLEINGVSLHGSDGDVVFAWQALAGLRFMINKHMGVSVEYRYFQADAPSWTADETFGTATDHVKFGHAYTHSASVAFDWRF